MKTGQVLSIDEAMALALDEAELGFGRVSPNPPVGAVILDKDGRLLASGRHAFYGGDHAEIAALKKIKDKKRLKKGSLIVTLEPCAHQGKTPPCAHHLAQLPFAKMIYGMKDPHPNVYGRGLRVLKASLQTQMYKGPLEPRLKRLTEVYVHNLKYKKSFLALKWASTLDGFMSLKGRRWITGPRARTEAARLRARFSAVGIGVNTFLKDKPRLNPRGLPHKIENKVVIFDPKGRSFDFLKESPLMKQRPPLSVIVVCERAPQKNKTDCHVLEQKIKPGGGFDLDPLFKRLFEMGVTSLMVEGGPRTLSPLLEKADRFYLFLAPFMAGRMGQSRFSPSLKTPKIKWGALERFSLGDDLLITGSR